MTFLFSVGRLEDADANHVVLGTRGDMDQRWRTLGIVVFTAAIFGGAALRSAEAKILAQWVQLGADGSSSVRAIADDACPSVSFDGIAVPMIVRSAPAQKLAGVKPAQFPVLGCEVAVPAGSVLSLIHI